MAAANQAKYKSGNIIMRVFEAWELKGIFNRIIIFWVYSLTKMFVEYTHVVAFEAYSKLIYGLVVVMVLTLSMYLLPAESVKEKVKYITVVFLSIFATYTAVQMQAEMTVVVLSVLSFSCIVSEKKPLVVIGGILGAFFFFSKSVFILLFVTILIGTAIYKPTIKKKNVLLAAMSMLIAEIILVVFVKVIYPQEFIDMKNAAEFQTTLFSTGSNESLISILTKFLNAYTQSCVAIPCLLVSSICAISLIIKYITNKEAFRALLIILCWLIPIDIIVASNKYFIYHYFLLMLPGIICILTYLSENEIRPLTAVLSIMLSTIGVAVCWHMKDGLVQWSIINYSTVLLVIIHLFIMFFAVELITCLNEYRFYATIIVLTVVCFFWGNYSSIFSPKHRNERQLAKQSEEICKRAFPDDFGNEAVLFLDAGSVPFYIDAPSYSRYFFNLPMNRWSDGKKWEVHRSEYEKIMQYNGKYIVYTSWFGLNRYPDLQEKINKEYTHLVDSGMYTFSPDWNVFSLSSLPDIRKTMATSDCHILVKNEYAPQINSHNYLNSTLEETSLNGLVVKPKGDGTYIVDGKATELTTFIFNTYDLFQAGDYKLVGCVDGGVDTYYLDCRADDGTQLIDEGDGVVFSTSGQSGYECRLVVNEGTELSNVVVKPMITNDTEKSYDDFIKYE